jgi:predicted metal-binding membrane protein
MSSMPGMGASTGMMGLFLVTWVVMMVAMMFPAIVPVVITFDRWVRRARRPRSATMTFVGGYLLVWTGFGLVVYAAVVYFQPRLPMGDGAIRLGAALLILAGVYQLTPLKSRCLRQCRSPLAFVAQHTSQLRRGGLATARVGVIHGAFCLGCCWALMLVLVLLGMMSLSWMAAVAGVIFIEKVVPRGSVVTLAVAVILVGLGFALVVSPRALPTLA